MGLQATNTVRQVRNRIRRNIVVMSTQTLFWYAPRHGYFGPGTPAAVEIAENYLPTPHTPILLLPPLDEEVRTLVGRLVALDQDTIPSRALVKP